MTTAAEDQFITTLYAEHARGLTRFVTDLVAGDRSAADDVVQETFIRAWRHRAVLQQSPMPLRGWLLTVARRIVINNWRSSQRRPELVTSTVPDIPDIDATNSVDTRQLVRFALQQLSPLHQQVLIERYVHGSTVDEAASRLGVPPGTIKSRLHYALIALRDTAGTGR